MSLTIEEIDAALDEARKRQTKSLDPDNGRIDDTTIRVIWKTFREASRQRDLDTGVLKVHAWDVGE
jgi:hypothetical protein